MTYYGAVSDYGADIDVFICQESVYDDAEVAIDIIRLGCASPMRSQQVPSHNNLMTPEEELRAVGKTSIRKQKITASVEAEIQKLLTTALQASSVTVKKLRETDLKPLF